MNREFIIRNRIKVHILSKKNKVRVHDGVNKAIIEFIEMYLVELINWSIVQLLLNISIRVYYAPREEKTWTVHSSSKLTPESNARVANISYGLANFTPVLFEVPSSYLRKMIGL